MEQNRQQLAGIIRQKRISSDMKMHELAEKSGVSISHISRIESGGRFPSAKSLSKIAQTLGLDVTETFIDAGFLSETRNKNAVRDKSSAPFLDPFVARILSSQPVGIQRLVVSIFHVMKAMSHNME